jgi:hydroxyethylthiazole kinase-like uncharacterized protein yjeF
MKAITSDQMRELDRIASAEFDIPGVELMRRAGNGVASVVSYIAEQARMGDTFVQLLAGRGNNGGDAFAAACYLHEDDFDVEVLLAGSASEVRGDALRHLSKMRQAGVPLHEMATKEDWDEAVHGAGSGMILVDGILGIGVNGPPRGPAAGAIRYINRCAEDNVVVSIDVPSGLNADTGESPGETVIADVTATIGLPKTGLLMPKAIRYIGSLDVVSIGIPLELANRYKSDRELITGWDVRRHMPRRPHDAHKGLYGHALVIGGSIGLAGAAAMAARAASRSGVGLTTALVPRTIYPVVAGASLEVMTYPAPETETGSLSADAWADWGPRINLFDAIVAGPGMTRHPDTAEWIRRLLSTCTRPLLLDADALNAFEGHPEALAQAAGPLIITPHPAELARLLGCPTTDVQNDREGAAQRAAALTHAVVVLKGSGTLVVKEGKTIHVNLTGNAGMASGGMGDVLSGIIGGLLAQGIPPFDAACAGAFLHGRAGDNAAWRKSQSSLCATDVIEELPFVFRELVSR